MYLFCRMHHVFFDYHSRAAHVVDALFTEGTSKTSVRQVFFSTFIVFAQRDVQGAEAFVAGMLSLCQTRVQIVKTASNPGLGPRKCRWNSQYAKLRQPRQPWFYDRQTIVRELPIMAHDANRRQD